MRLLRCESVSPGLRPEEVSVDVRNVVTGQRSAFRVEADFLSVHEGKNYITVGVIQEEPQQGLVLVELPQATDVGPLRLWVRSSDLLLPERVHA